LRSFAVRYRQNLQVTLTVTPRKQGMSTWQLYLFGPPRLLYNGEPVEIGLRKALALFVYLAATRQPHTRDALATLFWPDQGQRDARTALRRTLHRLQEALRTELLAVNGDQIALAPAAPLWVDLEAFQQAATQALAPQADPGAPATLAALTQAANLYADDFLAGFTLPDSPPFDDWQFFERESHRQTFAAVLVRLVEHYSNTQTWEEAIGYSRRWLLLDPLHEPAHRTLMELYASAGQSAAAVRQYQECVRLLKDELDVEPEAETVALFEAIRTRRFPAPEALPPVEIVQAPIAADPPVQASSPPPSPPTYQLPPQTTPFVGRESEVTAILDRLQDPACRLLTLVGPGGMGKTRLAVQAAQRLIERQPPAPYLAHGLFFVPLTTVTDANGLITALAAAVGLRFSGAQSPQQQLWAWVQAKQLLLVLDNFEQLLPHAVADGTAGDCVTLIAALLSHAPGLKLLITSREALKLQEEWFYPIGGLDFPRQPPGPGQRVHDYGAVRLFEQCARRVRPTFSLVENEQAVVRICRLVEGMPLAIELAAAWLKVLPVEAVVEEIEGNLDFLASRYQNLPERHRSLRMIFEQTWQRLAADEQRLLSRLSLFQDGFTREAAAQVAGGTILMLGDLVDKALLRHEEPALASHKGSDRFHFHPLLQQYAREKLQTTPILLAQTEAAHATYYLQLVERSAQTLNSADRKQAMAQVERELSNVRMAWRWVVEQQDLAALSRFALPLSAALVNQAQAGVQLFALAATTLDVTNPAHQLPLAVVLVAQAEQLLRLGTDLSQSIALLNQAWGLLEPLDAPQPKLRALSLLGMASWLQGDHRQAKTILEAALPVARQHGSPGEIGELLIRLGLVEREISEQAAVIDFYQRTLAELRRLGDPVNLAHQLLIYGEYLVNHDQVQQGQQSLQESLLLVQASGSTDFYPFILLHLALAAQKVGQLAEAGRYLQEIITISRAEERVHPEALAHLFLGRVKLAQTALAEAEAHLAEGLRLGWTHKLTLVMTLALVCFAELYAAQADLRRAVTLLAVALDHPATEARDKQAATRQLQTLQSQLPPAEFAQALAQGHGTDLNTIVIEILHRRSSVRSPELHLAAKSGIV
jgi:DNA-binding SARP family transcriptional activator/predicted ATPase